MAKETTLVLSGPANRRTQALARLEKAGALFESQTRSSQSQGLPGDEKLAWVNCSLEHIDRVGKLPAGWQLRLHWPTPKCLGCSGVGKVGAATCLRCTGAGVANNNVKRIAGGAPESPGSEI